MKDFFAQHGSALLISLAVGLVVGLPPVLGAHAVPGFAGIYKQTVDDQNYYLAQGKDVIDGHPFLANPYIAEHKNGYPLQVWLPDYLLAAPLGALGVSVQVGYAGYVFLFAAILFFVAYLIGWELTRSRGWAIGAALLLTVGYGGSSFVRLPSPGFNLIFLLFAWYFSIRVLRMCARIDVALALLSFGLLFHLYPYFWTFFAAGLGLFIAADFFLLHDRLYRPLSAVFFGGFAIGIPYFWSVYEAAKLPFYTETLERIGLIFSRFPSGISIVVLAAATIVVLWVSARKGVLPLRAHVAFLLSGVLGAIIAANQHLITGQNLEFSSHYLLPTVYWCVFALLYAIHAWHVHMPGRWRKAGIVALVLIVAGSSLFGAFKLVRTAYAYTPADENSQKYAPVLEWLGTHTPKDSVVFTSDDLGYYVPIYTASNVYSSGLGILFFMSDREAEERYIVNHYWDSFTPAYIIRHQRQIFGAQYIDEYGHDMSKNALRKLLRLPLPPYEPVPDVAIARVMAEAKAIQETSFESALKRYQADYVVWDTAAGSSWGLDRYPFLSRKYETGNFVVYKVN